MPDMATYNMASQLRHHVALTDSLVGLLAGGPPSDADLDVLAAGCQAETPPDLVGLQILDALRALPQDVRGGVINLCRGRRLGG